jgi:hypothetical protein
VHRLTTIALCWCVHVVATSYRDERRRPMEVDASLVIRVLGLLEVHAGNEADRRRELARLPAEQPPPMPRGVFDLNSCRLGSP